MSLSSGVSGAASGAAIGSAIPVIGTGIGAIVGGIAGLFSGSDDNASAEARQHAVDAINSLDVDALTKQQMLQQYQTNGKLDPVMIQKLPLNADQKQQITESASALANQKYAQDALKQMSQTGMSAQDMAQMQAQRSSVAQDTNAKTNQLLQQSQQRGTLSSGDTLAAQLMANQQGAQNASKGAIDIAAQAAQARQQALGQYGQMATQVRGQDYATQQANMQNELARQKFLDENSLSRQTANVGAQNQAQMYNLQRQQQVGDQNVGTANQYTQHLQDLKNQDAMGKAGMLANAYSGQATGLAADQAAQAAGTTSMWSGLTNAAGAIGKMNQADDTDTKSGAKTTSTTTPKYGAFGALGNIFSGKAHGGEIEGTAPFKGDTEENDIVPIMASPGELVIPRSKMSDAESAKAFIDKHFGTKKEPSKHEHLLDLIAELHGNKKKSKE
jgi:hypothetical protein